MSLFGQGPAPAAGGFTFGGGAPGPAAAPSGGFSFGASTAATPAPATGGLFGGAAASAPAPTSGFSFGNPAPAAAPTSTFGAGFGLANAPAPAATGGLFGVAPASAAPATSGFEFGAPAPAPAGGSSGSTLMFGSAPALGGFGAPAPSTVGFGAPAAGGGAPATGAGGAAGYVSPDTRYGDLPEEFKKGIDALAAEIKRQRGLADEVSRANPTHGLELLAQMRQLRRDLLDLGNEQGTQKLALEELKGDADRTRKHAEVHGTFLVQRLHSDSGLNTVEQLPSDYLWELVESFEKRLVEYAQEIHMIKEQLSDEPLQGGEAGNGTVAPYGQRARVTPERLAFVIREQWKSFNQIAGHAAAAHERIETLRQRYKHHVKDDPFEAAERRERAAQRRLEKQMRDQAPPQPAPVATPATAAFGTTPTAFGATPAPAATSGFGMFDKPATPAPAPAGSLFGQPAGAGLFGAPAPAPTAAGGGLFSSTPAAAPATRFGVFGAPTPAPAGTGTGLFGATAPASAPTGFGAFGAAAAPAPTGGGLFGATAPSRGVTFGSTTTFGAAAPVGGGLFGSAAPSTSSSTSTSKKKNKARSRRY